MKKISIRLTTFTNRDTTHPDFMDNLKKEIEERLNSGEFLQKTWVREIIIGKDVKEASS